MKKLIAFIIIVLSIFASLSGDNNTINVGYYDNSPKIFKENEKPAGFWAEITKEIAEREGISINWIFGSWNESLERLDSGDIDIMVDVGFTPERSERFLFNNETVQLSWTRVYRQKRSEIESILDLKNKVVGGLKESFDLNGPDGFKSVALKFHIPCEIVEYNDYESIFEALQQGRIDAGIIDKDFANLNESKYTVEQTAIVLQPAKMLYAFKKDYPKSLPLIDRFDIHLKQLKSSQNSIYYNALRKYLEGDKDSNSQKNWIIIYLIFAVITAGFVVLIRFLLKQVREKTKQVKRTVADKVNTKLKLQENQEKYESIVEETGDAIFIGDRDGNFIQVNPACTQLTGYSKRELLTMNMKELFNKQTMSEKPLRYDMLDIDKNYITERDILLKDGVIKPIEMNSKMLLNGDLITIMRDLSARKKVEQVIRESEENLRAMFNAMEQIIIEFDSEGRYINIAPTADNLLYNKAEEMLEKKVSEVLPSDVADQIMNKIEDSIANKQKNKITYNLNIKGNLKTFKATFVPKENGTVLFVAEDITEQNKINEELKKYREHLEDLVRERTRELEEKNKQLEEFNRLFIGREFRIKELKDELEKLKTGKEM